MAVSKLPKSPQLHQLAHTGLFRSDKRDKFFTKPNFERGSYSLPIEDGGGRERIWKPERMIRIWAGI